MKGARRYSSFREEHAAEKARLVEECTLCGDCLEVCPVFPYRSARQEGPVEVQEKLIDVLKGAGASAVAGEQAFSCASCGLCVPACPQGLSPLRLQEVLRSELVGCGYRPPPVPQPQIAGKTYDLNHVISCLQVKPSQVRWLTRVPPNPPKTEVLVFLGCNVLIMPDKVLALMDLLEMAGVDATVLMGGDLCCGSRFMQRGETGKVEKAVAEFIPGLSAFKPRKVAFWCGTCYQLTREEFPKYAEVDFEPLHVTQLLTELLPRLKLTRPITATATLHDSCNLGRKGKDFESARALLRAIPGLSLVEMSRNREDSPCCGGAAHRLYPEIGRAMRGEALEEARKTGAQVMVTVCHGCHRYFSLVHRDYPFRIRNFVTLLAESAGFSHRDWLQHYAGLGSLEAILTEAREYIEASPYTVEEFRQLLPLYFGPSFVRPTARA